MAEIIEANSVSALADRGNVNPEHTNSEFHKKYRHRLRRIVREELRAAS